MPQATRLLTVEELAHYLQVPRATIYKWRYSSEGPPASRVGRHLRYRLEDVDTWLNSRKRRLETPRSKNSI